MKDQKCRHNEKCAYLHTEKSNEQGKLNEILAMALVDQIKTTSNLIQEVTELKTKVKNLENQMEIKNHRIEFTEQETTKESETIQEDITQVLYECEKCNYKCEKKITFIKHKNTKHAKAASSKNDSDNKAVTSKDKFHCDQCIFSCSSKSSLKKHISQKHESLTNRPLIHCDKCDLTFLEKKEFEAHMEDKHCSNLENQENACKCTEETVCDKCLDYWVQKGKQTSEYN